MSSTHFANKIKAGEMIVIDAQLLTTTWLLGNLSPWFPGIFATRVRGGRSFDY